MSIRIWLLGIGGEVKLVCYKILDGGIEFCSSGSGIRELFLEEMSLISKL